MSTPTARRRTRRAPASQSAVASAFGFLGIVVERFGWPGAVLILGGWWVNTNATIEQKRRIIDLWILGDGLPSWWPLVLICGVCVLVVLAQAWKHNHEMAVLRERLDAVAADKNRLQALLASREFRHGEEFGSGEE